MSKSAMKRSASGAGESLAAGPPFDGRFFSTAFRERVRSLCAGQTGDGPVVLVKLTDGCVLDLCHIALLTPRWMAAAVYKDGETCGEMDIVFMPYETIIRVSVSKRGKERRLGFQLDKSASTLVQEESK